MLKKTKLWFGGRATVKLVLCEEVEEKDSGKEREDEIEEILAVCAYIHIHRYTNKAHVHMHIHT